MRLLISYFSLLLFLLTCQINHVFAQQKFTLSGYVKDASSGESMIAAIIGIKSTTIGAATNDYGFYSLTLPKNTYAITCSYLGYKTFDTTIILTQDVRLNINLTTEVKNLQEIVVSGTDTKDENVKSSQMGKFDLPMDKIKNLPIIFGEQDILKTIQLLPGVQSGGEGTTGFYVRGGGADQNLLLLDEATVYNSSHLFGFFSVFNSDAILNATLYKEGMPAQYGGRISSVLDVTMKEGNNQSYHASGGIGLIASRLTVEGPIVKNKCSFIASGRRTYVDVITRPFIKDPNAKNSGYYFYDFNAKINYRFSDKDRVFASGYFGRDVFSFKNEQIDLAIPWGNATTTLRWNHLFSNQLFMNASAMYNSYNFGLSAEQNVYAFSLNSGVQDFNAKVDFDFFPSVKHHIQYGLNYIYHVFQPQSISGKSGDVEFNQEGIAKKYGHEGALYLQDQWDVTEKIQLSGGLRFSLFDQVGPYVRRTFDPFTGDAIDSAVYAKGEHVKAYSGLEPRLLARYSLSPVSSMKAAFTINNQYVHLVSNNGTTLPTDIWVPSTLVVKPQIGYQYSLGYFRNFKENMFESSVEIYYKQLYNQIEFKEGYTPSPNEELEESFVFGTGDSYGAEFYLNKKYGTLTGWISYTLSYTNRHFPDLNSGNPFPYRYDRRHNLSVVTMYQLNTHWSLGAEFIYSTGIAYTLPEAKYFIEGTLITEFGPTNSFRLTPYHRLDVSVTYEGKKNKKLQSSWNLSVYNVYNHKNPYFIYDDYSGSFLKDPQVSVQAKQVTLFPILPSITWNFKF